MENFPKNPKQPEQGQGQETLQEAWERVQAEVALQPSTPAVRVSLSASKRVAERTKGVSSAVEGRIRGTEATLSRFEDRVNGEFLEAQDALAQALSRFEMGM